MRSRGRLATSVAVALVAALLVTLALRDTVDYDFVAFFCAGHARAAGLDPYLLGSLRACERAIRPSGVVVPAPLPPYALALFAVLARAPYPAASAVWDLTIVGASVTAAFALARLARTTWDLAALPLLVPLLFSSLLSGQVVPLLVAAIACAALFARCGRFVAAAAAACVTLIEPHVGVVVVCGLAFACGEARLPLAIGVAAVACASLAAAGASGNVEYLRRVLPAHAVSEISHQGQFSLAYVLHLAGAPVAFAEAAGALSSLVAAALGIAAGRSLSRRTDDAGYAVTVPAAFALAGGTFMHLPQMAAAVPAALMLAREPRAAPLARAAVVALAVPWADPTSIAGVSLVCAAIAGLLSYRAAPRLALASLVACATALAIVAANAAIASLPHGDPAAFASHVPPGALAELEWQKWVTIRFTFDPVLYLFLKLPTWLALGAVIWAAARTAWPPRATPAVP